MRMYETNIFKAANSEFIFDFTLTCSIKLGINVQLIQWSTNVKVLCLFSQANFDDKTFEFL